MSEWKTIESAPKDGNWIDAYCCKNGQRAIVKWGRYPHPDSLVTFGWLWWNYNDGWGSPPTHFQELPNPPTTGDANER